MKKASHMPTCDDTLLCADHGLNLVLEKAEKESKSGQLFGIIKKLDTLAFSAHRSSIFLQYLKTACAKESCQLYMDCQLSTNPLEFQV
jgi:hypothetical protein